LQISWRLKASLKQLGVKRGVHRKLASDLFTLVQNLDEYADVEAQVELFAKIINKTLEDSG
jgi:hypothetical protein